MSQAPTDTRSAAEKARDTAGIIGSLMHEGYVPNPEDEAIHQRAERGEITTEAAIAIFRVRNPARDMIIVANRCHWVPRLATQGCVITNNANKRFVCRYVRTGISTIGRSASSCVAYRLTTWS
jgi:hypothetical protein